MASTARQIDPERQTINAGVLRVLEDMTSDWETEFAGPIGPNTRLVCDLCFCSIDIVQLAIALEEFFECAGLPFQQLVTTPDGEYVDDVTVSELVLFLGRNLDGRKRKAS
jgi:acyl carrier protein